MAKENRSKGVSLMTREEFLAVPNVTPLAVIEFDSLVIVPTKRIHESDFRCMEAVACSDGYPIAKVALNSDVIHIDGISGLGWLESNSIFPKDLMVKRRGWRIDCLKASGLLQLFCWCKLKAMPDFCSSFEVFGIEKGDD